MWVRTCGADLKELDGRFRVARHSIVALVFVVPRDLLDGVSLGSSWPHITRTLRITGLGVSNPVVRPAAGFKRALKDASKPTLGRAGGLMCLGSPRARPHSLEFHVIEMLLDQPTMSATEKRIEWSIGTYEQPWAFEW